jgi:hypothetical protein
LLPPKSRRAGQNSEAYSADWRGIMPEFVLTFIGIIGGLLVIAGAVYVAAWPEMGLTSRNSWLAKLSAQPHDWGIGWNGDSGSTGSGWGCGHSGAGGGDSGGGCGDSGGGH